MSQVFLVSIIINNYNYGCFLKQAIDSALTQTYDNIEVIVVDDGSTDNSRDIIISYDQLVKIVLKDNGGQASAFNAGFEVSCGEVIIFLDADDVLLPTAVEKAVKALQEPNALKVHWYQWQADIIGNKTGEKYPPWVLREGDLREEIINHDLDVSIIAPTSGNAWKRTFIEAVYPVREMGDKHGVDEYLCYLVPLFGSIKLISEPQGHYRVHGENHRSSNRRSVFEKMQSDLKRRECLHSILDEYLQQQSIYVDPGNWKSKPGSYYNWLKNALDFHQAIEEQVPVAEKFILAGEHQWSEFFPNRIAIPFLERDGQYWGLPPDDETAIQELERLRNSGVNFIVFAWISFWWFETYAHFYQYLLEEYPCTLKNDLCVVFMLKSQNKL
jgi:glycosyltransferase involved in cell wall biosynthesis